MSTSHHLLSLASDQNISVLAIDAPDFELEVDDETKSATRKVAMFIVLAVVGMVIYQNAKPQSINAGNGFRFGAKAGFFAMLLALFLFEPDLIAPALNKVFTWFISFMEFTGLVDESA